MRKWWSVLDNLERAIVIAAGTLVLLLVIGISECAYALELNAAWKVRREGITGTTPKLVYNAAIDSTNAMRMPAAYLVWEKSGNAFQIRRFYDNVAEALWIDVPEGQSFTVPSPPLFRRTGSTAWWHKFSVVAASGDTILFLPMDR
jgi:hypothetical protein